jgi:hypothetical protein
VEAFRLLNPDPVALPQLLACAILIIVRPVQLWVAQSLTTPYISEMASDLSNHVIYNSCRQCVSAPNGDVTGYLKLHFLCLL